MVLIRKGKRWSYRQTADEHNSTFGFFFTFFHNLSHRLCLGEIPLRTTMFYGRNESGRGQGLCEPVYSNFTVTIHILKIKASYLLWEIPSFLATLFHQKKYHSDKYWNSNTSGEKWKTIVKSNSIYANTFILIQSVTTRCFQRFVYNKERRKRNKTTNLV